MIKKIKEKETVIALRKTGMSVNKIAKVVGVSKSSVSGWLKNLDFHENEKNKYYNSICLNKLKHKEFKLKLKELNKKIKEVKLKNIISTLVPVAQLDEHHPLSMERSMWKIEKIVKKGDYLYAVVYDHPNSIKHGYVLLHRIVMENSLGRLLNSDEVVHHKNENKFDNRIENLELMKVGQHERHHAISKGRLWVTIKCPSCGNVVERQYNKTHLQKGAVCTCCSATCRGKFYGKLPRGKTLEMERAISENVVRIYRKFLDNSEQTVTTGCVETIRPPSETMKK